jgi:hypothetical protein
MSQNGPGEDAIRIAHKLIRSFGLRAGAVAEAHATELQAQPDAAGLAKWRQVQVAISDFRSTAAGRESRPQL